ncbi:MAG: peptidylprolyl isomerase [Candidatus Eremiobacteraeota bacterium]|nr:peptidylprolyl isomerase [Candidatus Eremiobacteraeota bacterium]
MPLAKMVTAVLILAAVGAVSSPDSGAYTQMIALESRRSLGDGRLALFLASPDEAVAARAALAIGRTKQPAGEELLAAHLEDSRVAVRAMSVYGLGLLATGNNAAGLIAVTGDSSPAVRAAALDAVARYEAAHKFGNSEGEAQAEVERLLARDPEAVVRARAATALVEFRDGANAQEAAAALATAFAGDRETLVRWHAMWCIYRGYAARVNRKVVEGALKDPDELVRIEAVRAMGKYKDASLIALVKPLLADSSWRVQEQAAEAIRALSGKPPTEHVTAIPSYVHVPAVAADPLASLPAMPRTPAEGKPGAPSPDDADVRLTLLPETLARMTGAAPGPHPRVRVSTTKGNLYVVLYPEWAPLTVANFLALANRGYYDGNRWFRIVPDFVVQTGDPNDNGEGDAGYAIGAEENPLEQHSYVISMGLNYDDKTNTPIRDSAGTQYYVTLSPQLHLDRDFTVFGDVTGGFDVLGRLIESDRVKRIERIEDVVLP